MCTSLCYKDAAGKAYFGRTLELTMDLPYQIVFFPTGLPFTSQVDAHAPVHFTARRPFFAITMPGRIPTADAPLGLDDLKVIEGLNDQGLTFSLLSYPAAGGGKVPLATTQAVLSASDLGAWALAQFATVAEVRAAITAQPVLLEALKILGGVESPFHYVVHDASGASLVIEFNRGVMSLHDNPVGVMTNGPDFGWHLTNLNNYTFLSNVDQSSRSFGAYQATQPDSGIATVALPASNTSVGRFVRAAYFAQFSEKAGSPDEAVRTLAHIMNNFDRPRGATIDYPGAGGGHMEVAGLKETGTTPYATEFTCWTSLADLDRKQLHVRDYHGLNFASLDLGAFAAQKTPCVAPLAALSQAGGDVSARLLAAAKG